MTERREKFRVGLSTLYLPYYDALCNTLGEEWQPYCGVRTIEAQDFLYSIGRSKAGEIVTNAQGGVSGHNYGCASDWTLWEGSKPLWLVWDDPRWHDYVAAVVRVGARSGSEWKFHDNPHNELRITCSWKHVHVEYVKGGMTAAQQHIERNLENVPRPE